MSTLGYLFILFGILLARFGFRGVPLVDVPPALGKIATSLIAFDTAALEAAWNTEGSLGIAATEEQKGGFIVGQGSDIGGPGERGVLLLSAAKRLGSNAKGYRFGASGPDYYDCSGLVYRALVNIGAYKGVRFSVFTFPTAARGILESVVKPTIGDIVTWPATVGKVAHMGVIDGSDSYYSALSVGAGIKSISLSRFSQGRPVKYWRLKA